MKWWLFFALWVAILLVMPAYCQPDRQRRKKQKEELLEMLKPKAATENVPVVDEVRSVSKNGFSYRYFC